MKLGPSLTFYARYPQELDALCVDEPNYKELIPEIKGKRLNQVAEMVIAIINQSATDCKRFLDAGMSEIENNFTGKCKFLRVNKRSGWGAAGYLGRLREEPAPSRAKYGLSVYPVSNRLVVCGWLWVRGGRSKEEELRAITGGDGKTARSMGWSSSGDVCLYEFAIEPNDDELDLDIEPILKKTFEPFAVLTAKQIDAVLKLADR
ncbi:hypothetical protein [uncultured Thiodictyon sp.]|uniref:hypothetical protein n=1 Tax=uncultured Thiodictyon sp. TaxID=1846217 RepID=UPI0025D0DD68|nr:hypothetical protein [uncultured Thiodictyon sp.]